jgi:hypothetical protein
VIDVSFNGTPVSARSIEEFGSALDIFDREQQFELWVSHNDGPSMCMLRSGDDAFLMYQRFEGDPGYVSKRNSASPAVVKYRLSNGQVDDYPASWSLPIEQCYQAMAYFFVNDGLRPDWVQWVEQ